MEAPRRAEKERKTITALFADIKGSVELMEGLDPEKARGFTTVPEANPKILLRARVG